MRNVDGGKNGGVIQMSPTVIINCLCGIQLTEYTPPTDAPIAVRQGLCYLETDCPACGAHHRVPIPPTAG